MSWPLVELGDVANIFNGKTPSKKEQRDSGHPVLKIKNVDERGVFKGTFESFVDVDLLRKFENKKLNVDDTLILNAAHNADYVGSKQYRAEASVVGSLPTGEWLIARANGEYLHPRFLNYWLASSQARFRIKLLVKGIHLYPKDVARLEIPLPPLKEQKRIAAILDKADAIRRKRQQAIKLADDFLCSVFLDMFGDPVTNPKEWDELVLSDIANIRSGVTKGKKINLDTAISLPYMRVANVQDGYLDLSTIQKITVSPSDAAKCQLEKGDILLTEGGDPDKLGRGYVWNNEIDNCIHQNHIFSVRVKDESIIRPKFLSAVISSQRGKRYFLKVGKQTTGIATINKTVLSEFDPIIPPVVLQDRYLSIVEAKMNMTRAAGNDDTHLFNSLSQKAFSGAL